MDWTTIPKPESYADLYTHYGNPADESFAANYIVTTPHYLANGTAIHIQHHVAITPHIHNVFLNAGKLIAEYDGCYVVRNVRGSSAVSLHSWGLAIDVNASKNPLGATPNQPLALVAAFKGEGFWWGGDFQKRKDGMHFQYAGDF